MLRLQDIMTREVVTVAPELTIREVMSLFALRHVSGAPVVSSNTVLGVVSTTDLMDFIASLPEERAQPADALWEDTGEMPDDDPSSDFFRDSWEGAGVDVVERMRSLGEPDRNVLEEHSVAEAMTRSVFSMGPDARVDEAADRMRELGVHRVLVMQRGQLLGIVTTKDIANAVADHKLTAKRYVFSSKGSHDEDGLTR
jgi:CBS domain-containing protein